MLEQAFKLYYATEHEMIRVVSISIYIKIELVSSVESKVESKMNTHWLYRSQSVLLWDAFYCE